MRAALILAVAVALLSSVAVATPFPNPSQFAEPVLVPGLSANDYYPSLTPDGQHMVFQRGAPHQIYSADWDGTAWGNIQHIDLGVGGYNTHPSLSSDGQWLFFAAYDGSPYTQAEIYRSQKKEDGSWDTPLLVPLDKTTNSGNFSTFFDGTKLYFTRATFAGGPGEVEEIWCADYDPITNTLGTTVALPSPINTGTSSDRDPRIFGDGLTFVWASDRGEQAGSDMYDIWIASWDPDLGEWDREVSLGKINTTGAEFAPWYCATNKTLYFVSDNQVYQSEVLPEPATVLLIGSGLMGLLALHRRRRK